MISAEVPSALVEMGPGAIQVQDAPRPWTYPITDAIRAEVVVTPEYPAGRGPEDCPSVLRLNKGDIVYVLEQHESGWWGGHKEGDETTGWFPGSVAVAKPGSNRTGDSVEYDGDDENSRALERDHRAVASPQGAHKTRQSAGAEQLERLMQDLDVERKRVKELEAAQFMEREWKEKHLEDNRRLEALAAGYSEDVRRLEAEISRVRTERDAEKQERERERRQREQLEKELQERDQRHVQDSQGKDSESQVRHEREVADVRNALRSSRQDLSQLQEDMQKQQAEHRAELSRRDEQMAALQAHVAQSSALPQIQPIIQRTASEVQQLQQLQQLQPILSSRVVASSSPEAVAKMRDNHRINETSLLSDGGLALQGQGTPQGSGGREDVMQRAVIGRQASASITRQLFTQALSDEAPLTERGLHRHTSEPVQGNQTLTPIAQQNVVAAAPARIVSNHAAPPRPSPRGITHSTQLAHSHAVAHATPMQPWRSHSQGPIAASPRGGKAIAMQQALDNRNGPAAQVRAIVSEIERRSTSQTPGARTAEPATPTSRAMPATVRAASATAPCASARGLPSQPLPFAQPFTAMPTLPVSALSRGRSRMDEVELPHHSPLGSEEGCAAPVVFGMSPMGRPRGGAIRTGISTPSPTPKGPSVQDRIRALYGNH